MGKKSLPPGFRFHPTDVELVKYYLKRKVMGKKLRFEAIAVVNIYKFAPWDLPDKSYLRSGDLKWYFFCPREKKYANGARLNRATEFGYWKTTGKDRPVLYNDEVAGMIKTLVFHRGKASQGVRTDWVMHEYMLQDKDLAEKEVVQDAYVLCVIFQKDGLGPRNGAQYGAPFREEDWSDDEKVNCVEAALSAGLSAPVFGLSAPVFVEPSNQIISVCKSSHVPERLCVGSSSESCVSDTVLSAYKALPPVNDNSLMSDNSLMPMEVHQVPDDDILSMMAIFSGDESLVVNENAQNEEPDGINHAGNVEVPPRLDGNDIYNELADLGNLGGLNEGGYNFSGAFTLREMAPADDNFLELLDLDPPLNGGHMGNFYKI